MRSPDDRKDRFRQGNTVAARDGQSIVICVCRKPRLGLTLIVAVPPELRLAADNAVLISNSERASAERRQAGNNTCAGICNCKLLRRLLAEAHRCRSEGLAGRADACRVGRSRHRARDGDGLETDALSVTLITAMAASVGAAGRVPVMMPVLPSIVSQIGAPGSKLL